MILLAHYQNSPNLNIDAIYFGDSFIKLKNLENKFPYKFISLKKQINEISKLEKFFFLNWIEKKRKANNDSIYWWMNHLAGRNNLQSKLFLYLCHFYAIKRYLKSSKSKNILIICENFYLLKFLEKNLDLKFRVYKNIKYHFIFINNFLRNFFLKNSARLRSLTKIFLNFLFAYISKPRIQKKPIGKVILFHHCVNGRTTNIEKKKICNYFTHLPYFIRTHNISDTYGLFWAYNNLFSLKFFREMRSYKSFVPQDWLGLLDIIEVFLSLIKIKKNLKNYVAYKKKINLENLIDYEIHNQNTLDCFNFLCYIPAIKRWSSNLKELTIIDQYQNMVFEHCLRFAVKKLPIPTKSIGFHHSLVSRDILSYHSLAGEWQSQVKPDKILTIGKFGENFLNKGGIPKKKIIQFYSLRQKKIIKSKKDKNKIIVLLPIFIDSCFEILDMLTNINHVIKKNNYRIYIKFHPMLDKSKITNFFFRKKNNQNWKILNNNLYNELQDAYLVITSSSASVYDAVLNNCIPIVFKSELRQFDNYLDVFSILNKNIKSFEKNEIESFLKKDNKYKYFKESYIRQIKIIRNILINQTNFFTKKNFLKIKEII